MNYSWQRIQYGEKISWDPNTYNPTKHGIVMAIRLFYDIMRTPMAELAFAFGGTITIEWVNATQRGLFTKGINGYTLMYDTRITDNEEVIKELNYRFRQQIRKESHA